MFRWGHFGSFGGDMCSAVTSLVVILMSASVYNFVLVNLDRLLAFKRPFDYQPESSRRGIKRGISPFQYYYQNNTFAIQPCPSLLTFLS